MNNGKLTKEHIIRQGMLPLYYNEDETVSIEILKAEYRAGVRAIEYTNRGNKALANFSKMIAVRETEMPDMLIGIGTIKNYSTANDYLNAGADFFVSPGFVPDVAEYCMSDDIFYIPGCMTPTEIIAAESAGISFIKLFPGNLLGTEFLCSVKEIFPFLDFMPTGGVDTTKQNIESWFKAGVSAVGIGSKLISKKLMQERDYLTIESETRRILELINAIKNNQ